MNIRHRAGCEMSKKSGNRQKKSVMFAAAKKAYPRWQGERDDMGRNRPHLKSQSEEEGFALAFSAI